MLSLYFICWSIRILKSNLRIRYGRHVERSDMAKTMFYDYFGIEIQNFDALKFLHNFIFVSLDLMDLFIVAWVLLNLIGFAYFWHVACLVAPKRIDSG
jgi:hypothetical protein